MENHVGTYRVGIEADDLVDWTQETLAAALVEPLAELGFEVEVVRNSTVLESVELADAHLAGDEDQIREEVRAVVERVIEGEPLTAVSMLLDPPAGPEPKAVENTTPFHLWPVEERLHARNHRNRKSGEASHIENEIYNLLVDLSKARAVVAQFDARECPEIGDPREMARKEIAKFMKRMVENFAGDL